MSKSITMMVDLDGVVATEENFFERSLAKPMPGAREALQKLHDAGHTIVIYTARGWGEYKYTKAWLEENGMAYDQIHMGKPVAKVWIDDRALRFKNWDQTLADLHAEYGV